MCLGAIFVFALCFAGSAGEDTTEDPVYLGNDMTHSPFDQDGVAAATPSLNQDKPAPTPAREAGNPELSDSDDNRNPSLSPTPAREVGNPTRSDSNVDPIPSFTQSNPASSLSPNLKREAGNPKLSASDDNPTPPDIPKAMQDADNPNPSETVYTPTATSDRKDTRALSDDAVGRQSQDVADDVALAQDDVKAPQQQCDVISHGGCRLEEFERCVEPGTCVCLKGYVRKDGTCVAAQFFQGKIAFVDNFPADLMDTTSEVYRNFVYNVRLVVFKALVEEGGILDVFVTSVTRDVSKERVTVEWELGVTSASNPQRAELNLAYNKGIDDMAYVDAQDSMFKLTGTDFVLGPNGTISTFLLPLVEFSHCVDGNHNYCDVNADCFHSLGSFTCTCREGYNDVSPDVEETPGEQCAASCSCENNGTCSRDSDGNTECSCPGWYIGSHCEVDGKEVLIICCSVIGAVLILIALLCFVCICTSRRSRKSSRDSTAGVGSLDTSVVKLPRVWMDGARPYDLPPRDTRRWSYVSEPVRYVDEYMMDDYVHAGTLPLPRSHDAKKKYYAAYQVGSLNHGYSSSTLSARPMPRH